MSNAVSKPKTLKDLGSPSRVIGYAAIIFILSQVIAIFLIGIFAGLAKTGSANNFFSNSIPAQFFYVLIAEGLAGGLSIAFVRRRKLSLGFIGLGRRPKLTDFYKAAGGFIVFYLILIVVGLILALLLPNFKTDQSQNLGFTNLSSGLDSTLAFLALVIIPPLGEEPLMRGYLFSGLRARWRFVPAMLVTSLLFGLAHLEFGAGGPLVWAAAIDTFVLSLVLVYLRENTGALYAGIAVHMANNLIAFLVHYH